MVNVNLVCQSVLKEPLQARVSRSDYRLRFCNVFTLGSVAAMHSVATAITACGFVTSNTWDSYNRNTIGCNSDYRLRYKKET